RSSGTFDLQRRGNDRLRPRWRVGEPVAVRDAAVGEVENEPRAWSRERLEAVVEDLQSGELRHESGEIRPARVVPLPDARYRDVVPTTCDSRAYARDVSIGAVQRDVPDLDHHADV